MSNISNASQDSTTAVLRPHAGAAIMAAAESYPYVFAVILEAIQNAMDADATNVWIDIDWKKRSIEVFDDGEGVTREKFYEALQTIGRTIKGERASAYGQFGRGLVSPLGKCEYFTFTSNGLSWEFNTNAIRESADQIPIPTTEVPIVFSRSQQKRQAHPKDPNWRTRVTMVNVVRDRKISEVNIENLLTAAITNFRTKMLANDVVLHISVQPIQSERYTITRQAEPFSGTKLDVIECELSGDKRAKFVMFLALSHEGQYHGKLTVGTIANPFRLAFDVFVKSSDVRFLLDDEIIEALCSGVFEGEILSNALTLNPDRISFEVNDELIEYCEAIEFWYRTIGKEHYQEVLSREDSERFERNATKALDALSKLFDSPGMQALAELVQSFPANLTGIGGRELTDDDPDGETNTGTGKTPPKTTPSKTGTPKGKPGGGNKGGNKTKVIDPDGKERSTVKTHEFGLSLGETQNLSTPWQLDVRRGILWINTRHALYLQCADHSRNPDLCIRRYQQHVAIQALSLQCSPVETQHHAATAFDLELAAFVALLTL